MKRQIESEYFEWLIELSESLCSNSVSYKKLFEYLYSREFFSEVGRDANRVEDGKDLRLRFSEGSEKYTYRDVYKYLYNYPCSVLEMMVALAYRCEDIMHDFKLGDRTDIWFGEMLRSLHLENMTDDNYNQDYVAGVVDKLIDHKYKRNGDGGLFTVNNPRKNMQKVEIWYQMCWYLAEHDCDTDP